MSLKNNFVMVLLVFLVSGCFTLEDAVRTGIDQAVSQAVEQEMQNIMHNYTDVMLYQVAFSQAFYLGGYMIQPDELEVGHGTIWEVEIIDSDGNKSIVKAERALLSREEDNSTWWYLRYQPSPDDLIEYELFVDEQIRAREMHLRDPETGQIRHHIFDHDDSYEEETDQAVQEMDQTGYYAHPVYVDDYQQYKVEEEILRIANREIKANKLEHHISDPETGQRVLYRWWISEEIPGKLIKYEYEDETDGTLLRGKIIELRDDYQFQFHSM